MCGSRPLPDAVTRSTGTGIDGFSVFNFTTSSFTRSLSALLVGPRFEPDEFAALYGAGTVLLESAGSAADVADGRPWKYLSSLNSCPINEDPITLPSRAIRLPCAWVGKIALAIPVMASG